MASDDESTASEQTIKAAKTLKLQSLPQDPLPDQNLPSTELPHHELSRSLGSRDPPEDQSDTSVPANQSIDTTTATSGKSASTTTEPVSESCITKNADDSQHGHLAVPGSTHCQPESKGYHDPVLGIHAIFSTELGKHTPRPVPKDHPIILRSNYEDDIKSYVVSLRKRFSESCWSIFADPNIKPHGWDIRWFFDQYDFETMGPAFCIDVINTIVRQNEDEVVQFSKDFFHKNPCPWEIFTPALYGPLEKLFSPLDFEKRGSVFLAKVQEYMISAHERMLTSSTGQPPTVTSHPETGTAEANKFVSPDPIQNKSVGPTPLSAATEFPPGHGKREAQGSFSYSSSQASNTFPSPARSMHYAARPVMAPNTFYPPMFPDGYHVLPNIVPMFPNDPSFYQAMAMSQQQPGIPPVLLHHLPPFAPGPVPYPQILQFQQQAPYGFPPADPHAPFAWQARGEHETPSMAGRPSHHMQHSDLDMQASTPRGQEHDSAQIDELNAPSFQYPRTSRRGRVSSSSGTRRASISTLGARPGSSISMTPNTANRPYAVNTEIDSRNQEVSVQNSGRSDPRSRTLAKPALTEQGNFIRFTSISEIRPGHSKVPDQKSAECKSSTGSGSIEMLNKSPTKDLRVTRYYIGQDVDDAIELYVSNINYVDDEALMQCLESVAPVAWMKRVGTQPRVHAFVNFRTVKDARKVLNHAIDTGFSIKGQRLHVSTSRKHQTAEQNVYERSYSTYANETKVPHAMGTKYQTPQVLPQSAFKDASEALPVPASLGNKKDKDHVTPSYSPQDARSSLYPGRTDGQTEQKTQTEQKAQIEDNAVSQGHLTDLDTSVQPMKHVTQETPLGPARLSSVDSPKTPDTIAEISPKVEEIGEPQHQKAGAKQPKSKANSKTYNKKRTKSKSSVTEVKATGAMIEHVDTGDNLRAQSPHILEQKAEPNKPRPSLQKDCQHSPQSVNIASQKCSSSPPKIQPALPKSFAQAAKTAVSPAKQKPLENDAQQNLEPSILGDYNKSTLESKDSAVATRIRTSTSIEKFNPEPTAADASSKHEQLASQRKTSIGSSEKRNCAKGDPVPLDHHQVSSISSVASENNTPGVNANQPQVKTYSAVASSKPTQGSKSLILTSNDAKQTLKTDKLPSNTFAPSKMQAVSIAGIAQPSLSAIQSISSTPETAAKGPELEVTEPSCGQNQQQTVDLQPKETVVSPVRSLLPWEKDIQELHALAKRAPTTVRDDKIAEAQKLESSLQETKDELEKLDEKLETTSGYTKKKFVSKRKKRAEAYEGLEEELALKIGQYRRNEAERQQRSFSGSRYSGIGKGERMSLKPQTYRFSSCSEIIETDLSSRTGSSSQDTTDLSTKRDFDTSVDQLLEEGKRNSSSYSREIILRDGEEFQIPEGYTTKMGQDVVIKPEDVNSNDSSGQYRLSLTGLGISSANNSTEQRALTAVRIGPGSSSNAESRPRSDSEIARHLEASDSSQKEEVSPEDAQEEGSSVERTSKMSKPSFNSKEEEDETVNRETEIPSTSVSRAELSDKALTQANDDQPLPTQVSTFDASLDEVKGSAFPQDEEVAAGLLIESDESKVKQLVGDTARRIMSQFDLYSYDEQDLATCQKENLPENPNESIEHSYSNTEAAASAGETAPTSPAMSIKSMNSQSYGMSWAKVASQGVAPIDAKRRPSLVTPETPSGPLSVTTNLKQSMRLPEAQDMEGRSTADGSKADKGEEDDPWAVKKGNTWGKKSGSKSKGG